MTVNKNPFRLMTIGSFLAEVDSENELYAVFFRNKDGSIWDSESCECVPLNTYDTYLDDLTSTGNKIVAVALGPSTRFSNLDDGDYFYSKTSNQVYCKSDTDTATNVADDEESTFAANALIFDINDFAPLKGQSLMIPSVKPQSPAAPIIKPEDYFRTVDRCVYDFMSGVLGVRREHDGGYSVFSPPVKTSGKPTIKKVELNELGQSFPAVALRTKIANLKSGDVVILKDNTNAEKWIYYLNHTQESTTNYEVTGIDSETGTKLSINVADGMLLSGDSVLSVRNFLGDKNGMKKMLPFLLMSGSMDQNTLMMLMMSENSDDNMLPLLLMSQQNGQVMNPLVLMMLMNKDDKNADMKKMLPFLLMSQGNEQMNPMMLMMLMNDGEMDEKMLMMMALMGGQNGGGQMNPLAMMMMMGGNSPFSTPTPAEAVAK